MPNTYPYYPALSNLVRVDNFPEFLNIITQLSYYKNQKNTQHDCKNTTLCKNISLLIR
jgi:hypothetical protein